MLRASTFSLIDSEMFPPRSELELAQLEAFSNEAEPARQPPSPSPQPRPKNPKNGHAINGSTSNLLPIRRAAPHNLEAEQALLGAILIDNKILDRVAGDVRPADFYDPLHQQIFETLSKLIVSGKQATPITLRTFFESAEPIDGGQTVLQYLGYLGTTAAPTLTNAQAYGRVVRDLATQRAIILIAEDMARAAYDAPADFPPHQQIAEHNKRLMALDSAQPRLTAISAASFSGQPVPPREWHARDLVPAKNATTLSGDGGTGKSLLAAQLSVATVLGRPWFGHEVMRGPVVYLGAEDDLAEMHRRLADLAREQEVDLDHLDDLHICCLAGKDAVLASANERGIVEPTDLWFELRRIVLEVRPKLVVYDTLADLFAGNENARTHAQQFVSMLRGLALETDSTALLLAHPSLPVCRPEVARRARRPGAIAFGRASTLIGVRDGASNLIPTRESSHDEDELRPRRRGNSTALARWRFCSRRGPGNQSRARGEDPAGRSHFPRVAHRVQGCRQTRHLDDRCQLRARALRQRGARATHWQADARDCHEPPVRRQAHPSCGVWATE